MPFTIHRSPDGGYKVVKKTTGEVIPGESASKSKAVARIGAIESHLHEEGKDMNREKYDAGPPHPGKYGKPSGQTFDGTPAGKFSRTSLSSDKGDNATPALDPPTPPEENHDMHPWQQAMQRIGPTGTMRQLKAALMEMGGEGWH